jgi:alkylation response protein AidB-like acyl-CoA dehydrogenase
MPRLTQTEGLSALQRDVLAAVREFVDCEIIPVASELNQSDTYPDRIVAGLRELGVFGLTIDQRYGGFGEPSGASSSSASGSHRTDWRQEKP